MERIYHLTGTFSELQELLQSEFDMKKDDARFSVCLLLMEQQPTVEALDEEMAALWYLNKQESFTAPIFKLRFSISLTDMKKALMDQLIIQFSGMLVDKDALTFTTIMSCLLAIYRSGTYIKDEECCVYYQALEWKSTHATQDFFKVEDILPKEPENVCLYLENIKNGTWKCFECHNEVCETSAEKYRYILDDLCRRNVFMERNNMYCFMR